MVPKWYNSRVYGRIQPGGEVRKRTSKPLCVQGQTTTFLGDRKGYLRRGPWPVRESSVRPTRLCSYLFAINFIKTFCSGLELSYLSFSVKCGFSTTQQRASLLQLGSQPSVLVRHRQESSWMTLRNALFIIESFRSSVRVAIHLLQGELREGPANIH